MFELSESFVQEYSERPVEFGWGGSGEVSFMRSYSRSDNPKAPDGMEQWYQTCERVISNMFSLQEEHCVENGIPWNREKGQHAAMIAYDQIFNMKWTPPGRGLEMMGTDIVMGRNGYKRTPEALQNCAFISSEYLPKERGGFFYWLMRMSMLGVGVGFDTKGHGSLNIKQPFINDDPPMFEIQDSREGWCEALKHEVNSFLEGDMQVTYDVSLIRPRGAPVKGFGRTASGPEPLLEMLYMVRELLTARVGQPIRDVDIVDVCNLIGKCVVAGNVRRSAEIALGNPNSPDFYQLKDRNKFPARNNPVLEKAWSWVSNNSLFAEIGMNYDKFAERTYEDGEPGYVWMDNVHNYARMNKIIDTRDSDALGFNPCAEQPLGHKEMCTLVEIFLPRIDTKLEFQQVLKTAFLYGQTVTLQSQFMDDPITSETMVEKRRVGLSLTGITQFIGERGLDTFLDWTDHGYAIVKYYNQLYSQWLKINESVRLTSVKPSGTVSLVVGVTPGIHYNVAGRYHIRRVTIPDESPMIPILEEHGYHVEAYKYSPHTAVVEFPVDAGPGAISEDDIDPREHLELIRNVQRTWADNAISATVKFRKEKESPASIAEMIRQNENHLKTISFLPQISQTDYEQVPYETLTEEEYVKMAAGVRPLNGGNITEIGEGDRLADLYCSGDKCEVIVGT